MSCCFDINTQEIKRQIKEALAPIIKEKISIDIREDYSYIRILISEKESIAYFCMSTLPGCCAYLVLHDVLVFKKYRGLGIAQSLHPVKEFIADEGGFSFMMCTTRKDNPTQNHILEKTDWKKVHQGLNVRTKNDLIMWMKENKRI